MDIFFRFPSTPHLAWLGHGVMPREDKIFSAKDVLQILSGEVVVEEKVDGANIGLSLANDGQIRVQNRGQYLISPYGGQFARLPGWLSQYDNGLREVLSQDLIIFGEWCAARHTIAYYQLPDWFLLFDVYDRVAGRFWSTTQRNELAARAGIATVPTLHRGWSDLAALKQLLSATSSCFRMGTMEGLIVRRESEDWCDGRAKLVQADFIQNVGEHWRRRQIEWNRLGRSGC